MVEYIDIYDEKGNNTGLSLPKSEAHEKGLWHLSVDLWVITSDHKILIHKRSKDKEAFPGYWAQAAAGHVSTGETSIEAAIKEAREEIGLDFKPSDLEFLFSFPKIDTFYGKKVDHCSHFDVYLTERDINIDEIVIQPEEVEEARFVTLGELEQMINTPNTMLPFPFEYEKIVEILKKRFNE